jgi:hypothetical protein
VGCKFAAGTGIKVTIKPIYRVAPPVQLSPQGGEVPRSLFQFDFDLERRILAEAESQGQSFSRKPADHSRQSNGGSVSLTTSFSIFLLTRHTLAQSFETRM